MTPLTKTIVFVTIFAITFGYLAIGDWLWRRRNRIAAAVEYADWEQNTIPMTSHLDPSGSEGGLHRVPKSKPVP